MNRFISALCAAGVLVGLMPADADALGRRMTVTEFQNLASAGSSESAIMRGTPAAHHATKSQSDFKRKSAAPAKVMKRTTAGGANIFGYLFYSDDDNTPMGLYSLDPEGYSLMWEDPFLERAGQIYAGWQRNGVLNAVVLMVNDSGRTYAYNVTCDLYTGDVFDASQVASGGSYFTVAALNESDGCVYGVASQGSGWVFARAASGSPDIVTPICDADKEHNFLSLTYNVEDGKMYGVNQNLDFVTVAADGTVTVLKPVDVYKRPGDYQSALIYSALENKFYWNVCFEDYTSALYTIDPVDYSFTLVENYPNNEEFCFFVSPDGKADPSLPETPVYAGSDFGQGALSGYVEFQLPSTTGGGDQLASNLEWTAWLDNTEYKTGTDAPGSKVRLDFTNLQPGRHTFAMSVKAGNKESGRGRQSIFIGKDTPKAPENVSLTDAGELSWLPVTMGEHGGYIDLSALRYHISNADGEEVAVTAETSWKTTLPADKPLEAYRFGVNAEYDADHASGTIWSNYCVVGEPYELPFDVMPDKKEALLFTTLDANGDGLGWIFDDGVEFGTEAAFKCYVGMEDSDDWLFLPAIDFKEANKVYTFTFSARQLNYLFPNEYMQVFMGDKPEPSAMTKPISGILTPSADYSDFSSYVVPAKTGVTYVGIRVTSKAGMAGVALRQFVIADLGVSALTPSLPTDISVKTAAGGKLSATATLKLPTLDLKGDPIPANATLKANISNLSLGARTTSTEGKPGETVNIEFTTITGVNELELTVSYGELTTDPVSLSVYSGEALPVAVTGIKVEKTSDMMGMKLTWNPVTEGENGGYVNAEAITYNICRLVRTQFGNIWDFVDGGIKDTSYTYILPAGSEQDYIWLGVSATTSAGTCPTQSPVSAVIGTPYPLGMKEDFANMTSDVDFSLSPYVVSQPTAEYTGEWDAVTPSQISTQLSSQTGYYLIGYGQAGAKARIGIPCFSTKVDNAVLHLTTLSCYGVARVNVYAECEGVAPMLVGQASLSTSLTPHTDKIELPDTFAGRDWVQLYFDCSLSDDAQLAAIRGFAVYGKTGVKETAAEAALRVIGGNGMITVVGAEGGRIDIHTVDGRLAASVERAAATETFSLTAGIYIVNGVKVAVR